MRVREGRFLLQIKSLTITHRKDLRTIIQNFDFVLNRGDKAVLIGEEGNGKSTLLKWIYDPKLVKSYAEADGIRALQGELIGYLPQELADEEKEKTVYDYFSEQLMFQETNLYELEKLAAEIGLPSTFIYTDQKMQ